MRIHPILIVEDDPPTQMLLETILQRYGFPSVTAENGQIALDLLGARHFTAVILDLMMPHVGGIDVIDFIARQDKRVPVIVCTAAGLDKTGEFAPGVVGAVLRKPFDIEEMMATVFALAGHSMPSKVLIVGGDARSRAALKPLVAPATALEAEDGDQARAAIREHHPDVVVTTVASLHAELAGDGVPVVVIGKPDMSRQRLTDLFDAALGRG